MLVGALSMAGGGGDQMRESAAEARMAMRFELDALRESCLRWPERTVKCFDSPMWAALHRDECERRSVEAPRRWANRFPSGMPRLVPRHCGPDMARRSRR